MAITNSIKNIFFALNDNGMSLGSYLAQHGHDEAVQQFLDIGGQLKDVIYGYALAGNETQIAKLFEKYPFAKGSDCIGSAIRGYARSGHIDCIYAISTYRTYIPDCLIGLAQAGDKGKVTALLDRHVELFAQAVEGYASSNRGKLLNNLIKGTSYYPLAIYHAARSGHMALVTDLLQQCGIGINYRIAIGSSAAGSSTTDINRYSLLNHAITGYIAGRHFNAAATLLTQGASTSQCVSELKDDTGLPSRELYMAFLAHISDGKLREAVISKMNAQSKVMESLTITPSDIKNLESVLKCMEENHLNYLEALNKIGDASYHTTEGDITLPYLSATACAPDNDCTHPAVARI